MDSLTPSARASHMAGTRMERTVVDRGLWRPDFSQPRDMSERPGWYSLEFNWRSYERRGIMGLSGAEVVYRVQSKIDDYASAGTLPPGEVEGFWGQLELACINLRERVLEEDLGKRFQCLRK